MRCEENFPNSSVEAANLSTLDLPSSQTSCSETFLPLSLSRDWESSLSHSRGEAARCPQQSCSQVKPKKRPGLTLPSQQRHRVPGSWNRRKSQDRQPQSPLIWVPPLRQTAQASFHTHCWSPNGTSTHIRWRCQHNSNNVEKGEISQWDRSSRSKYFQKTPCCWLYMFSVNSLLLLLFKDCIQCGRKTYAKIHLSRSLHCYNYWNVYGPFKALAGFTCSMGWPHHVAFMENSCPLLI